MKILITGIGNIGKSTLREMVGARCPGKVIQIDMDYQIHAVVPDCSEKLVLVEDVHGLEGALISTIRSYILCLQKTIFCFG